MTPPPGRPAGAEVRQQPLARRQRVALALGLMTLLALGLSLLSYHRATMRRLSEKTAEAGRKEQELQELEQQLAADGQELDGASQQPRQAVSELAQVLDDSELQQRRLSELLGRIGPILEDGVELGSLQLGRERLSLSGCAASPQAVDRLVAALAELDYLERQPPKAGVIPEASAPASAPASAEASAPAKPEAGGTAIPEANAAGSCDGNPLKHSFDLEWAIRAKD